MSKRVSLPSRLLGAAPEFMLLEDDEELCDLCLGTGHERMNGIASSAAGNDSSRARD